MKRDISRNILRETASLRDVSERLNEGVGGFVLIVGADGAMTGMVTDGDLRRAFLAGSQMADSVADYMNRSFQWAREGTPREQLLKRLDGKIRHLPILDDRNRPIDFVSWNEIWRVPISEPTLGGNELKYLSDCIQTMWISSQGGYIQQFEAMVKTFLGAEHALCVSSGTTALHLALAALDVGPGDEVIIPSITFGACANAVIHVGAKPVFADIDPVTKTLDPVAVQAAITPRTRAIMPVHLYGHPCDMDAISEIARERGLKVIEDCAEAFGARYRGRPVGCLGDVGCFSFYANKVITTGEGGMVLTQDKRLHERMGRLRDHGMEKSRRYWHVEPGFNFRMTNIQAAIGLAQMERVEGFLQRRVEIGRRYREGLGAVPGIVHPPSANWADRIYWLYCIEVEAGTRDSLMDKLRKAGIDTRAVFPPLNVQPAFGSEPAGRHPVGESYAARGICLPTSNGMTDGEIDRVVNEIAAVMN